MTSLRSKRARLCALALAAGVVLAGCADSPTASESSSTAVAAGSGSAAASGAADSSSAVSTLPADLQAAYEGLDQPIGATPLADFKAQNAKPWTIGYASSYAGNSWRAEALSRLQELVAKYKEAGIVKELVVTESNLNDATQIQQIRQLADQGVDAIIICCSSITSLNEAISYAYDKGVPVFSWSGYTTSPVSLNVSANYRQGGAEAAKWLAESIGGKGTVLNVVGIPGAASSDTYDAGAQEEFAKYPDIKVVGNVAGNWTDQVAQTAVQQFLATNPGQIDGILTQSAQETGVLQALLQSGRPVVPMNIGGEAGAACYWRQNKDWVSQGFNIWPPGDEMQLAFETAIRTLQGPGPKIQSIIREPLPMTYEEVEAALPADCDVNGSGWIQPGPDKWMPASQLNEYFSRPADPMAGS
ncbi:ABC transporter substrate-binding protein [Nakamurella sp. GG22]